MFKTEFKKLCIKQFGLILFIVCVIGEIIFVNYLYSEREFITESTEQHFYEYMKVFSGKLTSEKITAILAEQEQIVDAQNAEHAIENQLINGKYSNEQEFIAEYEQYNLITQRSEAFDLIFEQFSYALESPNERFLTIGNYSGLGMDFPDVLLLVLVIFLTSVLFLNEEDSNVINFIKISENGKQKTLMGKLLSIFILIISAQIIRTFMEFFLIVLRGNIHELNYPIQSIEFFQNCQFGITILQGFFAISALRLLGYIFVSAFIVILSVTIHKPLPVIFIPSTICFLQQFLFSTLTPVYYFPTGLLRAVGYFRGDVFSKNNSGDEVKLLSAIPISHLILLITMTVVFILFSLILAYKYYSGKSFNTFLRKIIGFFLVVSFCSMLNGCSSTLTKNIKFNFSESRFFAQNEDNYYISGNNEIMQVSKTDGLETNLIHNAFADINPSNIIAKPIITIDDDLYYLNNLDINRISLADYGEKQVFTNDYTNSVGFLGINLSKRTDYNILSILRGFFTDEKNFYYIYDDRVLKGSECIIDESIYNFMLCYDGQKIYYINNLLQLKYYDTRTGETIRLPGEFVRAVYYDGTRILYSDKNGIFELTQSDFSSKKVSDKIAYSLSSDGERIIYSYDNKIYLLNDSPIEVYDREIMSLSIISGTNKVATLHYDYSSEILDLPVTTN